MPKSLSLLLLILFILKTSTARSVLQNTDCSYHSSNYSVSWTYDELSNDIVFKLTARSPFSNFYTAIGFGAEKPDDVIAVYVRSLQIGLIDGHLAEDGAIESDEKTNVQALQFDLQNGVLTAQFARPIETFDSQDADLGSCVTMFLPTESQEIITGAPLELGNVKNLQKIRVCDIAVTCATKMHNDVLVKRQEDSDIAPICATAPEDQKNRIAWKVDGDLMRFTVTQNAKKGRWWTAIGVGHSMNDLNMILLFAETGKLKKEGLYRTEGKMVPEELQLEDVSLKKELAVVEHAKAHYELAIEKKFFLDKADEQGCFTLQVGVLAGQYRPNFSIDKHQNTPQAIQVCNVDACSTPVQPTPEVEGDPVAVTVAPESDQPVKPNLEDVEASGAPAEPVVHVNEVEGSGLPVADAPGAPGAEGAAGEGATASTVKTAEVADEKPLTGEGEENSPTSSSSSPSTPSTASTASSPSSSSSSAPIAPIVTAPEAVPASSSPPPVFIVDNKTTEKLDDAQDFEKKTSKTPEEVDGEVEDRRKNTGCGAEHEDLKICQSYFDEYLGKVNDWSEKHNMTVSSHMWKACTLLSEVQHVTTMCCSIFRFTCATHLNL